MALMMSLVLEMEKLMFERRRGSRAVGHMDLDLRRGLGQRSSCSHSHLLKFVKLKSSTVYYLRAKLSDRWYLIKLCVQDNCKCFKWF